ncbi:uncharacterized protein cd79b [Thunnus maccoyii]|uniref:uncharacterized protein cd79b n=1 Tax=Thunnus maccoyii TaxID=8240 RepID=UPI001C4C25BC|nr:uncharacterized protein cd79b [Thunnus maccoyii]
MRWLLARYCGLALIYLSVALNEAQVLTQVPRFYGVKTRQTVYIYCENYSRLQGEVQWYKTNVDGKEEKQITQGPRTELRTGVKSCLQLMDLNTEDSGVYFCRINNITGPGTGLQVVRNVNVREALYRSKMKDGLMVFQGLLLAVCIAAVLLRKHSLLKEKDSIYEEPETDHIYEGLAIETCGGGLYEELSVYTQAEGGEAPWE